MILAKTFSASPSVKPERRLQQPLAARVVQVDLHLLELLHVLDDPVEQRGQFLARRAADEFSTVISFSSSVGISSTGEMRMMVL